MAKENTKVMAAKPAKAAPAAKPQKTPNPESFFNRFAKPVGKLGLVGAITAGSIGFVNELTKDQIATNWYEFALSSYMEMGDSIEGWERHATEENFNIISEGTSGSVTEYMVYCKEAIAEDCTTEADMLGVAFKAEANHGGYGNMIFQVAVSTANGSPEMAAYNQLGFVTSFAKQTGIILDDLDKMIADKTELQVDAFISGASTTTTIGGINSMLGDMRATYDSVASEPGDVVKGHLNNLQGLGNLDGTTVAANIDETTEINLEYTSNQAVWSAELADDSLLLMMKFSHEHSSANVLFHVQTDGKFTWDIRSGGFASGPGYGVDLVYDRLDEGLTTSINDLDSDISGASGDTAGGARTMIIFTQRAFADKGGFA